MPQERATAPRTRNAWGQGSRLRTELVEAAATLLSALEQPETLTLRQVARAAGVAPASVYDHFSDLGALVESVLELRYAELSARMHDADVASGPLERLVGRCLIYLGWADAHPGEYRTLFSGRLPVGVASSAVAHRSGAELLAELTAALAATTDPDNADSDTDHTQAGLLLWTALHGLVTARAEHPNLPWQATGELVPALLALHTRLPVSQIAACVPVRTVSGESREA
jgi:AcrR family transcriptional regulator